MLPRGRDSAGLFPPHRLWYLARMKNLLLSLVLVPFLAVAQDRVPAHPYIKFETSEGDIVLELDGRRAPLTVANFLKLVELVRSSRSIF